MGPTCAPWKTALALYTHAQTKAGACGLWVEKEQWLNGLALPERLEDLEVVQQR